MGFPNLYDTQIEFEQLVHLSHFLCLKLTVNLDYFAFIWDTFSQVDSPNIANTGLFWVSSVFGQELVESIDVSEEVEAGLRHGLVGEPGGEEAVIQFGEEYGVEAVMFDELEVGLIVAVDF